MREAGKRLLQAIRFERDAFVWMDFNDRATADGLVLVMVTRVLILLGAGFSILGLTTSISGLELLLNAIFNALIFWLAYSGLLLAVVRFIFQGSGGYATLLRITGFAYPTLLLVIFTARLGLPAIPALVLGALWFLAIVATGVRYEGDLPIERAAASAGLAFVAWIIIALILGRGLI
jgi:hypothetical protein